MSKTIRKISVEKINKVESHAQMLYNAVIDNKSKLPPNDFQLRKHVAFQEAVSAVLLELIAAIKGEDR